MEKGITKLSILVVAMISREPTTRGNLAQVGHTVDVP